MGSMKRLTKRIVRNLTAMQGEGKTSSILAVSTSFRFNKPDYSGEILRKSGCRGKCGRRGFCLNTPILPKYRGFQVFPSGFSWISHSFDGSLRVRIFSMTGVQVGRDSEFDLLRDPEKQRTIFGSLWGEPPRSPRAQMLATPGSCRGGIHQQGCGFDGQCRRVSVCSRHVAASGKECKV